MHRSRTYNGTSFWWLLAFAPAVAVALYALAGALWQPLLVATQGEECSSRSFPRPVDFVLGISFVGGGTAALGGAYRTRRRPRMPGVVTHAMGLGLVAAGLILYAVLAFNGLNVERCPRD